MKTAAAFALLLALSPAAVRAATQTDDLKHEEDRINAEVGRKPPAIHTADLSEKFGVPPGSIDQLRVAGKSWGAVTIELALAERLAGADPSAYPTTESALRDVGRLRAAGFGYGQITRQLGFDVGDIVNAARRDRLITNTPSATNSKKTAPKPAGRKTK